MLAALDALAHATHEASTVFIYYSGHGARAAGGSDDGYYLVPVDATAASRDDLEHTAISSTELTARLRAIPAGRLTLVLDCCRAASMADLRLAEAITPTRPGARPCGPRGLARDRLCVPDTGRSRQQHDRLPGRRPARRRAGVSPA